MKKLLQIICLLGGLFTAHLFADMYDYPCTNKCWYNGLEVGAEWLYWKADQSQMEIASDVSASGGVQSSALRPDFRYTNGYRIYANYDLGYCWTLGAAFTHLPSKATISEFNDPAALETNFIVINSPLFPLFTAFNDQAPPVFFSSLDSDWDLNLYYLDVDISRTISLCRCLDLSPYFGFKGLWMRQKWNIDGASPANPLGAAFFSATFKEKAWGVGLEGGIQGNWQLGCGFSLLGQFGGALLYSNFHVDEDLTGVIGTVDSLTISVRDHVHKSFVTVDTFVGAQYTYCYCNCSLEVHLGWENHLFFHTNQFPLIGTGNLTTQGLTLGGSVKF